MTNAGRRPDGPGWYWYDGTYPGDYSPERYEGPVSTGITFAWLTGDEKEYPIDGIRLCRAVPVAEATPAPTWSQEPPTEAGWWWRWSPPRGVELYLIEPELGDGPLWNATDPADDMMYPVSRTVSVPGIYWLPATVPQPPTGEVGE